MPFFLRGSRGGDAHLPLLGRFRRARIKWRNQRFHHAVIPQAAFLDVIRDLGELCGEVAVRDAMDEWHVAHHKFRVERNFEFAWERFGQTQ